MVIVRFAHYSLLVLCSISDIPEVLLVDFIDTWSVEDRELFGRKPKVLVGFVRWLKQHRRGRIRLETFMKNHVNGRWGRRILIKLTLDHGFYVVGAHASGKMNNKFCCFRLRIGGIAFVHQVVFRP